jgi:hypothetical protein
MREITGLISSTSFKEKDLHLGDTFTLIRMKAKSERSKPSSLDGEIKAIMKELQSYGVDLSIHFSTTLMLERPVKSCRCWGELKPANAEVMYSMYKSVECGPPYAQSWELSLTKVVSVAMRVKFILMTLSLWVSQVILIQKRKLRTLVWMPRGQFYDHSPSNIDFCCSLCNFLKKTILSVKAMLHLDSQLDRNLAGFWKGIHNVSYHDDDDDNDAFLMKVDLSNLVIGALGIAFPSIMFTDSYTPDTRNISKKDWDMAVVKSNEIKEMFKEEGEVWNNVDEAYNIAMEMSVKAVEEH